MRKVIVVGAGAAGLMAACAASDAGAQVTVLEHNEKAGKKIYITGKGRCNYTNACETGDFFANVPRNPKFLYSAVYGFDSSAVTKFLNDNGCATKQERGKRCFPASDHAFDVTDALVRHLRAKGAELCFHAEVTSVLTRPLSDVEDDLYDDAQTKRTKDRKKGPDAKVTGVGLANGKKLEADAVIIATGGMSYASTGSTGDGWRFAKDLGILTEPARASLVPLVLEEKWPEDLQGLSLRNVSLRMEPWEEARETAEPALGKTKTKKNRKSIYEGFGELLFTHFGISGPLVLTASCHTDFQKHPEGYGLYLDLKPALSEEELVARIVREIALAPRKELRNLLKALLPERLAGILAEKFSETLAAPAAQGGGQRLSYTLNEKELRLLAGYLKAVPLHAVGTRGFSEAIVTAGGIRVREINPSTMEARKVADLFFAGEVLDVDAYTGGFNLQIAWSTGHLAGESAAGA